MNVRAYRKFCELGGGGVVGGFTAGKNEAFPLFVFQTFDFTSCLLVFWFSSKAPDCAMDLTGATNQQITPSLKMAYGLGLISHKIACRCVLFILNPGASTPHTLCTVTYTLQTVFDVHQQSSVCSRL